MLAKTLSSPINPTFLNPDLDRFVHQQIKTIYSSKLSDIPVNSRSEHCALVQLTAKSSDAELSCDVVGELTEGGVTYTIRRLEAKYLSLSGAARTYEELPFRKNQIKALTKDVCEKMSIDAILQS